MNFRTSRRTLIASLALAPVMMKAMPAFALTAQQELIDEARITFDKLITALEFGELPGYVKKAKAIMIFPDIFKAGLVIGGQGGSGPPAGARRRQGLEPAGLLHAGRRQSRPADRRPVLRDHLHDHE